MDIGWVMEELVGDWGSYSGDIVYFVLFKEYIWGLIQIFDEIRKNLTLLSLILAILLYAKYLCSRDALGQARRATIGYLVYKPF